MAGKSHAPHTRSRTHTRAQALTHMHDARVHPKLRFFCPLAAGAWWRLCHSTESTLTSWLGLVRCLDSLKLGSFLDLTVRDSWTPPPWGLNLSVPAEDLGKGGLARASTLGVPPARPMSLLPLDYSLGS